MNKTLEQLYFGHISPNNQFVICNEEYDKAKKIMDEATQSFTSKLTQEMKDEFEELMFRNMDVTIFEDVQNFTDGFKLGVKIMIETFYDN